MYVIRLMRDCNNRCKFCMVKNEMLQAKQRPIASPATIINDILQNEPPGGEVDFFGGEPTLYPHLIDVIQFARKNGYKCTIASNGRRFSDLQFTQSLAALGLAEVRSTLLGHVSSIHNFLSGSGPNSFHQTIKGFRNILQCAIPLQVNIVVLKQNFEFLPEITNLLVKIGVDNIKYSSQIRVDNCPQYAVRHTDVRLHLYKAIAQAERVKINSISIEKAPMCLYPRYHQYFIPETDAAANRRMPKQLKSCQSCVLNNQCFGPDLGYIDTFGSQEFRPIT